MGSVNRCYGRRLSALLDLEGMTQGELASRLGMTQGAVSKIVHGVSPFSEELVTRLALEFDVPPSFFARTPRVSDAAAATFRKKSSTRAREERRIGVLVQLAGDLWRVTSLESGYRTFVPPQMSGLDAEDAAAAIREVAGLRADAPVGSMTRLVERMGVAVVANLDPERSYGTDMAGVSHPSASEDRPLVGTLAPKRGDVQRLTIAHELAHLLFDHDMARAPRARSPQELKAFDFAGALLLPEAPLRELVHERSMLTDLLRIKARFGVSLMAIIKRASRLHLISDMRAKSLYGQINARGWRFDEPVEVPIETPALFLQAAERVWPGLPVRRIAEETGVPSCFIMPWIGVSHMSGAREERQEGAQVINLAARRAVMASTGRM